MKLTQLAKLSENSDANETKVLKHGESHGVLEIGTVVEGDKGSVIITKIWVMVGIGDPDVFVEYRYSAKDGRTGNSKDSLSNFIRTYLT